MNRFLKRGFLVLVLFAIWTWIVCTVDVQVLGETKTAVGLATVNGWFHRLTDVHLWLYVITDWLGLVPIFVCLLFAVLGIYQAIKRKSIRKVDFDILILGCYYVVVILCYLIFEMIPINYRPILIDGRIEASYPSSTTLLVLSIMPTLVFGAGNRLRNKTVVCRIHFLTVLFCVFMVVARLVSGVHWLSDIVGGILLSTGLFLLYCGVCTRRNDYGIQRKIAGTQKKQRPHPRRIG